MAAFLPILLQAIPYVVKYGPDAVAGVVRVIDAIRSHPDTSAGEREALDAAQAHLLATAARVAAASEVA